MRLSPIAFLDCLIPLALGAASCAPSRDAYAELVDEARACETTAGDTCGLVPTCGGCFAPVNSDDVETLTRTFESVDCCPPFAACNLAECNDVDGAVCEQDRCAPLLASD